MNITSPPDFKVIAIIAAYNEGDVIAQVVGDLIGQRVDVYLLDHGSSDDTVSRVEPYLGQGLLRIERFQQELDQGGWDKFVWEQILHRKEQLASELHANWFIHRDADEFRESPWPGMSLRDAVYKVDRLGCNSIDFELLNFRPTYDALQQCHDPREAFTFYAAADT